MYILVVGGLLCLGYFYASTARTDKDADLVQLAYSMVEQMAVRDPLGDYSGLRIQCLARMARYVTDPEEGMLYLQKGLNIGARDLDKIFLICMYVTRRMSITENNGSHDAALYQLLDTAETLIHQNLIKDPNIVDTPIWTFKMFKLIVLGLKSVALLRDGFAGDALELARVGLTLLKHETEIHYNLGYPWAMMYLIKVHNS